MERIFKKTKNFFTLKQADILSSALTLSLMIFISRLFGFFRYRILSTFFNKEMLDIYFASFRLPDIIFEIIITGALTSSFIPVYIKYSRSKKFNREISSIVTFIMAILFLLITLVFIFLPFIIPIITPGFGKEKTEQIIYLTRLLLIGQLPFLVLGNLLTGISQANRIFLLPAIVPIIYNLAVIVITILFANQLFLVAPVLGIIVGAILFFTIQLPLLRATEFRFRPVFRRTKALVQFLRMAVPRTLTTIASQIDATIDLSLTTILGTGSYTAFYLAQRLQLLPVAIVGIAFGQASLPYLSEMYQQKRMEEFKRIIIDSILKIFFFSFPIASFFIFARTPIVRLFFGSHKFDWQATVETATILSYFALSLPFHSIFYFLVRCFYASLDTKTPFYISLFTVFVNISLSLLSVLVFKLPTFSLAITFSIAITLNVGILFLVINHRLGGLNFKKVIIESIKIITAAFLSSVVAYYLMKLLDGLIFDLSRTINVFLLLVIIFTFYIAFYLILAWLFGAKEIYSLKGLIIRLSNYKKKIMEINQLVE